MAVLSQKTKRKVPAVGQIRQFKLVRQNRQKTQANQAILANLPAELEFGRFVDMQMDQGMGLGLGWQGGKGGQDVTCSLTCPLDFTIKKEIPNVTRQINDIICSKLCSGVVCCVGCEGCMM